MPDLTLVSTKSNSARLGERVLAYVVSSKASSTRRAYQSDWSHFSFWCAHYGHKPLPASPKTVPLYLTDFADTYKTSTLSRRLSSISLAHKMAGHETPTTRQPVRNVFAGICRTNGTAPEGKAPLLTEDVRELVAACPDTLQGLLYGGVERLGRSKRCQRGR